MKKIVIIFTLFMLFKPMLPIVEYVVFYDYIKNELCENKEITELECNGKCHLAKEMAKASDTPENGKDKKLTPVELNIIFFNETKEIRFEYISCSELQSKINSEYSNFYSYSEITSVFHPPVLV